MRIHIFDTLGPAWQVTGGGPRRVLVRRFDGAGAARVSRFISAGTASGYKPVTAAASPADLFGTEIEARTEFARRQQLLPADARWGRPRSASVAAPPRPRGRPRKVAADGVGVVA